MSYMTEIGNILQQFLQALSDEISAKLPSVSGKTKASFEVNVKEQIGGGVRGDLKAAHYIYTYEFGRPPTRPNAPKGNPTLQEAILEWVKAKGISWTKTVKTKAGIKSKIMSAEAISWAIAIKIHREGNALFRKLGGYGNAGNGFLSSSLSNRRIDAFVESFGTKAGRFLLADVFKTLNTK